MLCRSLKWQAHRHITQAYSTSRPLSLIVHFTQWLERSLVYGKTEQASLCVQIKLYDLTYSTRPFPPVSNIQQLVLSLTRGSPPPQTETLMTWMFREVTVRPAWLTKYREYDRLRGERLGSYAYCVCYSHSSAGESHLTTSSSAVLPRHGAQAANSPSFIAPNHTLEWKNMATQWQLHWSLAPCVYLS